MLQTILRSAIRCGVFEKNISLQPFRDVVVPQCRVVPASVTKADAGVLMMVEDGDSYSLVVLSRDEGFLSGFSGEFHAEHEGGVAYFALKCPLEHGNAVALRAACPGTAPSVLEAPRSFGFGDRIGGSSPATPWHIEACSGHDVVPVLAQQSVRENLKTGRTFESVMDDVTWSVLLAGYKKPWGADADHLKRMEEIDEAVRAGFTMFTVDPSELIDNAADDDGDDVLARKLDALFENEREKDEFISSYEGVEGAGAGDVARAGVKYLAAVRHAVEAYNRLVELKGGSNFNFELSIDETSTPTTPLDHRIIAGELSKNGVKLYSLAPRFAGRFEKGIDYIGSVDDFRRSLEEHAAVARESGGYRLSLHSGSDKFSIYPAFGEITGGTFHVKTAGTSFLEAVKVAALEDIDLFRRMMALSVETFEENAASYDISADAGRVPDPAGISSGDAVALLTSDADVRQVIHIAFGVILRTMGDELRALLRSRGEVYEKCIVTHLGKHLSLLLE